MATKKDIRLLTQAIAESKEIDFLYPLNDGKGPLCPRWGTPTKLEDDIVWIGQGGDPEALPLKRVTKVEHTNPPAMI